jgi:hypothetical protein
MKAGTWVAVGAGVLALGAAGFLLYRSKGGGSAAALPPSAPAPMYVGAAPAPSTGLTPSTGANAYDVMGMFAQAGASIVGSLAKAGVFDSEPTPTDPKTATKATAAASTAQL